MYFFTFSTYVLLIKEVILGVFVCTPHVLKEWGYVPLPVIHYYKTCSEQYLRLKREPKSQLNNLHKLSEYSCQRLPQVSSIPRERGIESHISRQKLLSFTFYFSVSYWKWREMGEIARDTQLSQSRAKEKKTAVAAGVSRAHCYRRAFKKRSMRKVSVSSVFEVSVARRGFPAARRRDRNRSARRSATPYALCVAPPRAYLARASSASISPSHSPGPVPHASHGRPRFPAVRLRPQHGCTSLQTSVYQL